MALALDVNQRTERIERNRAGDGRPGRRNVLGIAALADAEQAGVKIIGDAACMNQRIGDDGACGIGGFVERNRRLAFLDAEYATIGGSQYVRPVRRIPVDARPPE